MPVSTSNCNGNMSLTVNDKLFLCALYLNWHNWNFEDEISSGVTQLLRSVKPAAIAGCDLRSTDMLAEMHTSFGKFCKLGVIVTAVQLHPVKWTPQTAYQIVRSGWESYNAAYNLLESITHEFYGTRDYDQYCAHTTKVYEELLARTIDNNNNNLEKLYQQKVAKVLAL